MILRKQIDRLKKPFSKGSKYERFAPAVNAFDTFLFVPNHTTQKGAHIRDAVDLKRTMVTVIIALIPALIYGIYNTGYQYYIQTGEAFTVLDAFLHGSFKILPMIAVSYGVGLAIEFAFAVYRGHEVNEGYLDASSFVTFSNEAIYWNLNSDSNPYNDNSLSYFFPTNQLYNTNWLEEVSQVNALVCPSPVYC